MKNLTKKQISWIIALIILVILAIVYSFNIFNSRTKTVNAISQITIPFSLIVNPNNVDRGVTPDGINTNVKNIESEKKNVISMVEGINQNYKDNHKLYFLSKQQQKELNDKVKKQPHQYIFSITLLNFGKDHSGKYFTISCNQYNDTKTIVSYRYILHYQKEQITTSRYVGKKSNKYPPDFLIKDIEVGKDGIKDSKSFTQQLRTAIINSGLISNQNAIPGDFNQIAINIGLDGDDSNKGLYQLAKHANSRLTNFAITGYEISDVPRYSRIFIKQINNDNNYYYTLTYNRNSKKYMSLQAGIHSNRLAK
ncbi:hypothetical protein [Companilactobacillus furfuricola]|uniref:hypothetical protein n=1 Tax=Companilactobacillus furfuricola TaxID=1462575 RepID=UPI000F7B4AB0|nr:hypothetical protein [Companilactobacillus furfuricola]